MGALSLLIWAPGVAHGQNDIEPEEEALKETDEISSPATPEEDVAPAQAEDEPADREPEDAELEEETGEPRPAPDAVEPAPDEAAVEPMSETAPTEPEEDEPDYYGSYDPISPSYRLEDVPKKPPYDGPFRAGRIRLGISVGGGTYGAETYFIPGFGVGYFLVNGLEVHVDTDFWLIGDPFLATPSPGLRYVLWMVPKVHPYFGAFYRHYFVGSGFDDADAVGGRAGVYFMTGRRSYFGLGAAYEHMLQDHLFAQTDFIYPEIAFVFAF